MDLGKKIQEKQEEHQRLLNQINKLREGLEQSKNLVFTIQGEIKALQELKEEQTKKQSKKINNKK